MSVRILNWSNRRALAPIAEAIRSFKEQHPGADVAQVERPLSDFEHQGIEGVAAQYDIVIFDHPFCGRIAASGCFEPLETSLPDLLGDDRAALYIGPSLATYRYRTHVWGAPIDGATQNAAYRPDLLERVGGKVPQSHGDVLELGRRARHAGMWLGTALQTPHAFMSILSYMANMGQPVRADDDALLEIPRASFARAYQAMHDVMQLSPPEARGWNSIDLHEQMIARDNIVYTPAVYGYATYGEEDMRHRLGFAPFAGLEAPYHAGSTIGGTALGLSASASDRDMALAFIRHALQLGIVERRIGRHHGQAAARAEWDDQEIDRIFNGFQSGSYSSMETAWMRPRYPAYPEFQRKAGEAMASCLLAGADVAKAHGMLCDIAGLGVRAGAAR